MLRIRITLNADPDPASHESDWNLRPLVYRISRARFRVSRPPSFHGSIVSLSKVSDFNADPDPAYHSNADPDPAFKNNANLDPELSF